jgi:hypothetical protein
MSDIPALDFVYDIETYPNLFSCAVVHVASGTRWIFEVSSRLNQAREFITFLMWLRQIGARMFGFNNENFDYPVIHHLIGIGEFSAYDAYLKSVSIIESKDRFGHVIWSRDRHIIQGDLFKIYHFDNPARSTGLKKLEVAMRSARVIDLPVEPGSYLTPEQMDITIVYMCHDVAETVKFYMHSLDRIAFRDELAVKYPDMGDVLNFNDTKIGKKFFERELEIRLPGSCYQNHKVRQTFRSEIRIADVISPKIHFDDPEFQRIVVWFSQQVLRRDERGDLKIDGVFTGIRARVDGFDFVFGAGGIHGSVNLQSIRESETHEIVDVDVASFYPNLAIVNRWFPSHLGEAFCDIYADVYAMRQSFKKGTAENAMLKLALNGVYGDSNNPHSPFLDPQYTMAITINGQLSICMLAESILAIPGVSVIQANTDGITALVPRARRADFDSRLRQWEIHTGLTLETNEYREMHIRDVNSYLAVSRKGKIKRIGAYAHETPHDNPNTLEVPWHKDNSALVVPKAVEAYLVHGTPIEDFIMGHRDPFDFMLCVKVPRSSSLRFGDEIVQNVCRYYVSTKGRALTKVMPPAKGGSQNREISVQKGWTVLLVNDVADWDWRTVNWFYYINEARKLLT